MSNPSITDSHLGRARGDGSRLNVAVIRAKQVLHVVCSFDPSQIPTDEKAFSKNPDLVYFWRCLKYASAVIERRNSEAQAILNSFDVSGVLTLRKTSNFYNDVLRKIAALGYQVSTEIGRPGFYIDIGIHHPVIHSNLILGIECDGAIFHSMPYARDHDKTRRSFLPPEGGELRGSGRKIGPKPAKASWQC